MSSRFFGCDPPRFPCAGCDFAIEGHRGFQNAERAALCLVNDKGIVDLARFALENARFNTNAGSPKHGDSAAVHFRVWVFHRTDDTWDAGLDQGFGAWRRPALVRTRFEIRVNSGPACRCSRLFECEDFGMPDPFVRVESLTNYLAVFHDDGA